MTKVSWNEVGQRFYEAGTDRGVLYLEGKPGVPWNGLVGVSESAIGGDAKPYYMDGFKYLNVAAAEEYGATISAFGSPSEFAVCDGTGYIHNGLFATQQPRKQFGFSYRSLIGNDIDGVDHGYKIHIVYNALAAPAERAYSTIGDDVSPLTLSWAITTNPPLLSGIKPTAHFVIDSRLTPPRLLDTIEGILYGTAAEDARLLTAEELNALFNSLPPISAMNYATNGSFELPTTNVTVRRNFIRYLTTATTGFVATGSPSAFISENGRLKLTAPGTTNRLGVTTALVSPKAAGSYAISFKVQAPDPTITHIRCILYDSATASIRASVSIPVIGAGIGDTVYKFSMTATDVFNTIYMEGVSGTGMIATGALVYLSEPLAEVGTVFGPYFNGTQRPKERRNAATQPQARSATGWFSNDGTLYARTWDAAGGKRVGAGAAVFTRTATSPNSVLASVYAVGLPTWTGITDWVPVTPGDEWTVSAEAVSDKDFNSRMIVAFRDAAGNAVGASLTGIPTINTPANQWAQASHTVIVPAGAVAMGALQNVNLATGVTVGGEKTKMTDAIFENISAPRAFFDSTTTPPVGFGYASEGTVGLSPSYMYDSDVSVFWTSTSGASESDVQGVQPAVYVSPSSVVRTIQSTRWAKAGAKSLRQIPVYTARNSGYTELASSAAPRGLIAGQTYTGVITFYQEAPQGFVVAPISQRSLALVGTTGGLQNAWVQASDVAGEQEIRLFFTIPTEGLWYLRLYNGGMLGDPSVWWDNFMITDGIYYGPAFNGDTPDTDIRQYDWLGAVNDSVSTLRSWYYN